MDMKAQQTLPEANVVLALFTDGGVIWRNKSPYGGAWAFVGTDGQGLNVIERSGLAIVPPGKLISNNTTEFMAAVCALETMPDGWNGTLYTDSEVTLKRLKHILSRVHFNLNIELPTGLPRNVFERGIAAARRMGHINVVLLQGHPTKVELATGIGKSGRVVSIHNVRCDELCTEQQETWKEGDGAERFRRGQAGYCHVCGFNLKEFNAPGANPYICLNCLRERDAAR
jgi:ribonuclease HI